MAEKFSTTLTWEGDVEIGRQGGLEVSDHAPVILDLHSS